ncbi:MAG: hypothetical protein AMJ55_13485 [Gammaproteobacteria bacterium SG8_15]|nr:MAG: hypothetical protein AMJ55_13485 [Gammaproteobacteria bacterium SG8_15]
MECHFHLERTCDSNQRHVTFNDSGNNTGLLTIRLKLIGIGASDFCTFESNQRKFHNTENLLTHHYIFNIIGTVKLVIKDRVRRCYGDGDTGFFQVFFVEKNLSRDTTELSFQQIRLAHFCRDTDK